jgi:hypothetical protein
MALLKEKCMCAFFCMAMIPVLISSAIAMEEKDPERRNSREGKSIERRNSRRDEFGEMKSRAGSEEEIFNSSAYCSESKKGKTCIYAWDEKCGTDAKESSRMNDAGDGALDVMATKRIISDYTADVDNAFLLEVIAGVPVDERAAFVVALEQFVNSKTDLSDASSLDLERVDAEKHDALIILLNAIRDEKLG